MTADQAAQAVAQGAAHGNCHVKPGEDLPAAFDGEEIGDDGGSGGSVAGFADADEEARDEEHGERCGQPRAAGEETPEQYADADENPAGHSVGKPAEDGGGEQVGDDEGGGECAG